MVNIEQFIHRMEQILQFYGLSASAFADRIGVQRSSLSHLMSGRNKPSLDFVMKICEEFHEVDLYWFLQGKGQFPKSGVPVNAVNLFQESYPVQAETTATSLLNPDETFLKLETLRKKEELISKSEDLASEETKKNNIKFKETSDLFEQKQTIKTEKNNHTNKPEDTLIQENERSESWNLNTRETMQGDDVEKIVIFYKNGTFKAYTTRK